MTLRVCDSAHCSGADAEINEVCKQAGWPVNHPVLTRDANGICTCSCSCLAHTTPVQTGDGSFKAIETYVVGDTVMTAGVNLDWKPAEVVYSGGTTGASRQKYTVVVSYGDTGIAVTSDHLFLMPDGTLKAADRLTTDDVLVGPKGEKIKIKAVQIGDLYAGFHHVATSKSKPSDDFTGHLLNTNGVVSADYTLQIFYRGGDLKHRLAANHDTLEIVGSPAYVARHGRFSLEAPPVGNFNNANFVSSDASRLQIPEDAAPFISKEEAEQKRSFNARPWNDPQSREWTEAVLHLHKVFYPQITFTLDWANDEVNAYAWVANGVRHVAILGGLVRNLSLELEGIAVVTAHEIGHHYGGNPTYPGGLTCEGQADYYGVSIVMRKVWFGEDYITKTDRGIAQMAAFFGVPNSPTDPGGVGTCSHPPGRCRISTYHRAVQLAGRPTCAN